MTRKNKNIWEKINNQSTDFSQEIPEKYPRDSRLAERLKKFSISSQDLREATSSKREVKFPKNEPNVLKCAGCETNLSRKCFITCSLCSTSLCVKCSKLRKTKIEEIQKKITTGCVSTVMLPIHFHL